MSNSAGFTDYEISNGSASIAFNASDSPDVNGSYWYMEGEVSGWDSPDGRVTMLTKIGAGPNADGEIPADQHYRGRTFLITLHCVCTSEANRQASRDLIAQVLDLVDATGTFFVNETVPKSCTISRSGNNNYGRLVLTDEGFTSQPVITPGFTVPAPDDDGLLYLFKAELEFYAQDPRKYSYPVSGPTPIEDNAVTLDNVGNTDSTNFFILITGDIEGYDGTLTLTLTNGSKTQVMELKVPSVPAGAPSLSLFPTELGIDFLSQTVTDGSGNNYYYLRNLQTPWLILLPGENVITFSGPDGEVDGESTWNSAWI